MSADAGFLFGKESSPPSASSKCRFFGVSDVVIVVSVTLESGPDPTIAMAAVCSSLVCSKAAGFVSEVESLAFSFSAAANLSSAAAFSLASASVAATSASFFDSASAALV